MTARSSLTVVFACAALAIGALGGASGCGRSTLQTAKDSPETLGAAVLAALENEDVAALEALALTEEEFRSVVWPELPAARPERNLSAEYLWTDLHTKSQAGIRNALATGGGQGLSLVRVQFMRGTTQYRNYLVHRDALLTVRDERDQERTVRFFGSVLEQNGRFKVFSYVVD
jgi:hypothetical protein